jgi:hypothetical protein
VNRAAPRKIDGPRRWRHGPFERAMALYHQEDDDWDDDVDDDLDNDDEPTIPCPHCREDIHEDAQRCPHCGQYISDEDAPAARKPWWIILGVIACLYLVYRWTVG